MPAATSPAQVAPGATSLLSLLGKAQSRKELGFPAPIHQKQESALWATGLLLDQALEPQGPPVGCMMVGP